jgi:hypothetical protein
MPAFQRMAQRKLPMTVAYWLGKRLKKVEKENRQFEELRRALVERLGRKTDKGLEIAPSDANFPEFDKEMKSLLELPVTLDIDPIRLSDLETDKDPVTISDLMLLDPFVAAEFRDEPPRK